MRTPTFERGVRIKYGKEGLGWYPHFCLEVGGGSTIYFSHDCSCEGAPLKNLFPSLYAVAANKGPNSASYCKHVFGSCVWSPIFNWDALVDEATLISFLTKLNGISIRGSYFDLVRWDLKSKGIFTVNSYWMKHLPLPSTPLQPNSSDCFL